MTDDTPPEAPLTRTDNAGITTLTLNRPVAHNTLSIALLSSLQTQLDQIATDATTRVVIIAAQGKSFCAGHDVKEMRANPARQAHQALFDQCARMMLSIVNSPKPVIARVQGMATAAGCQLVASCDLAIASESSGFCTPGVNIGLFCSTPMVALSRNVPRKVAMEMLLTGNVMTPATAAQWGLINRVVADDVLIDETEALAAQIASKSSMTLATGKKAYYEQIDMSLADAYSHTGRVMAENMMAHDAIEGIDAFLEKRTPIWQDR
ncbi:MAG: enoyl-CoA hydratase [Alphaproteobacteria bacterium]|jgi:enoyl-CoA hydratase/carnithine racemase|nr:enoyl-CoA hydratase [Alphaproteobacteria bacterium]